MITKFVFAERSDKTLFRGIALVEYKYQRREEVDEQRVLAVMFPEDHNFAALLEEVLHENWRGIQSSTNLCPYQQVFAHLPQIEDILDLLISEDLITVSSYKKAAEHLREQATFAGQKDGSE